MLHSKQTWGRIVVTVSVNRTLALNPSSQLIANLASLLMFALHSVPRAVSPAATTRVHGRCEDCLLYTSDAADE